MSLFRFLTTKFHEWKWACAPRVCNYVKSNDRFHMQGIIIRALVTTDVKQTLGQGMVHNFAICTSYA